MRLRTAHYWKEALSLLKHPEGGWFKEVYRSPEQIQASGLPNRFNAPRSIATSIYFILEAKEHSVFHRIKSDETWHFYDGDPLEIHIINQEGTYQRVLLGLDPENGSFPQVTIPHSCWFAAQTLGEFTLVGCTVAPGFDFHDFEMAAGLELRKGFPQHIKIIDQFTKTT